MPVGQVFVYFYLVFTTAVGLSQFFFSYFLSLKRNVLAPSRYLNRPRPWNQWQGDRAATTQIAFSQVSDEG